MPELRYRRHELIVQPLQLLLLDSIDLGIDDDDLAMLGSHLIDFLQHRFNLLLVGHLSHQSL